MARRGIIWALILLMAIALVAGCSSKPKDADVATSVQQDDTNVNANTAADARKTVLYFRDASGYLVPVMKKIPLEEGIAKAALKCLVAGTAEDAKLTAMGVEATIPKGTTIDLDIAGGKATVNLKMTAKCADKTAEDCMVASVVNTLLDFSTVDTVSIQINGQITPKLPNGGVIEAKYTEPLLNIEPAGAPGTAEGKVELCFANAAGKLIVPVYRVAGDNSNLAGALTEMMRPAENTQLVSVFPPSCDVIGVNIKDNGDAEINLSKEFASIADNPVLEANTIRAINAVCKQFKDVKNVKLLVDGKAYEPTVSTAATISNNADGYLNYYE